MKEKLEYLDSVITIIDNYLRAINDNKEIMWQLTMGGATQVLTSKFGWDIENYAIAAKWCKITRKKLRV